MQHVGTLLLQNAQLPLEEVTPEELLDEEPPEDDPLEEVTPEELLDEDSPEDDPPEEEIPDELLDVVTPDELITTVHAPAPPLKAVVSMQPTSPKRH